MKNDLYRSRLADQMLSEYLKAFGAVCVEGPKWCGKTWLAQHQAASACMIADPTDNFATRGRIEGDCGSGTQEDRRSDGCWWTRSVRFDRCRGACVCRLSA